MLFQLNFEADEMACIYIAELGHSFSLWNLILNMLGSRNNTFLAPLFGSLGR